MGRNYPTLLSLTYAPTHIHWPMSFFLTFIFELSPLKLGDVSKILERRKKKGIFKGMEIIYGGFFFSVIAHEMQIAKCAPKCVEF